MYTIAQHDVVQMVGLHKGCSLETLDEVRPAALLTLFFCRFSRPFGALLCL